MPSPVSVKYKVYRVAVVVFGAVFGFFLHTLVLLAVPGGSNYAGLPWLAAVAGALGGIPLGHVWWRIVYVEKRSGVWRKH